LITAETGRISRTPNKVQTDNPTKVICFGGEGLFIGGSCSWRDFHCGAAAALTVGGYEEKK